VRESSGICREAAKLWTWVAERVNAYAHSTLQTAYDSTGVPRDLVKRILVYSRRKKPLDVKQAMSELSSR